jgi:hypothetical protein
MFIAVLPADGPPTEILTVLHSRLGKPGTYAVVAGLSFRAAATRGFPHAPPLAEQAFDGHSGEGVRAVLADFVRRVADARQTGGAQAGGGFSPAGGAPDEGGGSSAWPVAILGLLGLGGGAAWFGVRRGRRRREVAEVEEIAREGPAGEDVHVDGVFYDDEDP